MTTHLIELCKTQKMLSTLFNKKERINDEIVINFLNTCPEKLSVYKLEQHSGYSNILLYEGVYISSYDFTSEMSTKLSSLPRVNAYTSYPTEVLKRIVLKQLFTNPFDNRAKNKYKPSAEKMWENIYNIFI